MKPPIKYPGSKYRLAPWVVSHFPRHRIFVDAFGGSGAVLLAKQPSEVEIYNDLDQNVVNLFRCLKDKEKCAELTRLVSLTPYSFTEYTDAFQSLMKEENLSEIERALNFVIVSHMGFRAKSVNTTNTSRTASFETAIHKEKYTGYYIWQEVPKRFMPICKRFKNVYVDNRDVFKLLKHYDEPETLWYFDPPYIQDIVQNTYVIDNFDHERFVDKIKQLEGMVVLSGYLSELYTEQLPWHVETKQTLNSANHHRTECLWMNPRAEKRLQGNSLLKLMNERTGG